LAACEWLALCRRACERMEVRRVLLLRLLLLLKLLVLLLLHVCESVCVCV
jgi:hypothetical protein